MVSLAPEELSKVDIFCDLSLSHLEHIARLGRLLHFPAGMMLAKAGETADTLFLIMDGKVELYTDSPVGEVTVRVVGPCEAFPLAALVGSGQLITSARAMTEVEVFGIPARGLLDLCEFETDIGMRVYKMAAGIMAERYRATLARMTSAMQESLQGADIWANV